MVDLYRKVEIDNMGIRMMADVLIGALDCDDKQFNRG